MHLSPNPNRYSVFKREFGYLATFSFAVSISGLFATVATTFIFPLMAGGPFQRGLVLARLWAWLHVYCLLRR